MRINHYISSAGVCSRRKADELIVTGLVKLNGVIHRNVGTEIKTSDNVEVFINGIWSIISIPTNTITYAVNKPVNYTSSSKDKFADKLIVDLVPKIPRVFSVGRLDDVSEGLILLTNDGNMVNQLTHPSKHVRKTYIATVSIPLKYNHRLLSANLSKLESGVMIDKKLTAPSKISLLSTPSKIINTFEVKIVLSEGRNRQIRKMFQKIGLNVAKLTRVAIGKLELKSLKLKPGQYKVLSEKEIALAR